MGFPKIRSNLWEIPLIIVDSTLGSTLGSPFLGIDYFPNPKLFLWVSMSMLGQCNPSQTLRGERL